MRNSRLPGPAAVLGVARLQALILGPYPNLFRKRRFITGAERGTGRLRQRGHDDMSVARKIGDVDRMIRGSQKGPLIIRDEWG